MWQDSKDRHYHFFLQDRYLCPMSDMTQKMATTDTVVASETAMHAGRGGIVSWVSFTADGVTRGLSEIS
jgi:hypothetical protein